VRTLEDELKDLMEDPPPAKAKSRTHEDLGRFLNDANRVLAVLER
jgi:hypothetical protein